MKSFFTRAVDATDIKAWCEKHGLTGEAFEAPCQNCGAPRVADQPFAFEHIRGLCSKPCIACGDDSGVPFVCGPSIWDYQEKTPAPKKRRARAKVIPLRRPS